MGTSAIVSSNSLEDEKRLCASKNIIVVQYYRYFSFYLSVDEIKGLYRDKR